jgi:hypothetical protein
MCTIFSNPRKTNKILSPTDRPESVALDEVAEGERTQNGARRGDAEQPGLLRAGEHVA